MTKNTLNLLALLSVATVTLWSFTGCANPKTEGNEGLSVKLSSSINFRDGKYYLTFQLENQSDVPVKLYSDNLPWSSPYSVNLIVAIPRKVNFTIPSILPVISPSPATVELVKGNPLSGEIDLSSWHPGFEDLSHGDDSVVYWSYKLQDVNNNHSPRVASWHEIKSLIKSVK